MLLFCPAFKEPRMTYTLFHFSILSPQQLLDGGKAERKPKDQALKQRVGGLNPGLSSLSSSLCPLLHTNSHHFPSSTLLSASHFGRLTTCRTGPCLFDYVTVQSAQTLTVLNNEHIIWSISTSAVAEEGGDFWGTSPPPTAAAMGMSDRAAAAETLEEISN